jgi:hypothetical protein
VFENPVESDKVRNKVINETDDEVISLNDIWPDTNFQTTENRHDWYLKDDVTSEQDTACIT